MEASKAAPHSLKSDPLARSLGAETWTTLYTSLLEANTTTALQAEELYTLSVAAYLTGRDAESVDFLSQAHQQFIAQENTHQAIRCAFWIGMQSLLRGEGARSSGWFARAQRMLEALQHAPAEAALLKIPKAVGFLHQGQAEKALSLFQEIAAAGAAYNEPDLSTLGRLGCGQALILQGNTAEGLRSLDEAMVAVEAEGGCPLVVGIVYCAVIETCQKIFDIRRAQEWTAVLSQWCTAQPDLVPFRGQCLIRRSQIRGLHGEWQAALEEMQQACHYLTQPPGEPAAGEAYYQLAELYRLRGNYQQAELAYGEANKWGRKPLPGLALLQHAQQEQKGDLSTLQAALQEAKDDLVRIQLLPASVELLLASGSLDEARFSAEQLLSLSQRYNTPYLHALAACAQGKVLLEEENTDQALEQLHTACRLWTVLAIPYEAACIRLLLGRAYRKKGEEETATLEFTAAQWVFQELEALPDLARAKALIKGKSRQEKSGLSLRELQVLQLVAIGDTNKAIANKLFISNKTVERHLSNIFTKLRVDSRTAAATYALSAKLL